MKVEELKKNKWFRVAFVFVTVVIPIITFVGTFSLWVDARYMHKVMADARYIETRIWIVERAITDHENKILNQLPITPDEKRVYDLNVSEMKELISERNRLMGVGQ